MPAKTIRVRVEVTAEDIRRGEPLGALSCPVARGLRRALNVRRPFQVAAGHFEILIGWYHHETPAAVTRFMQAFDTTAAPGMAARRRALKPFAFTIRLPADLGLPRVPRPRRPPINPAGG